MKTKNKNQEEMKRLNIGCGKDVREGWINLDMHSHYGADVIFDLNKIFGGEKIPFQDNSIDYIYCSHVIEDFIDAMPILNEFIRICKIGGKIEIRTPSETNIWSGNPYHIKPYSLRMFKNMIKRSNYGEETPLKVEKLFYYSGDNGGNLFLRLYKNSFLWLFNKLGDKIENTPLEYLMRMKDVGVIYKKLNNSLKRTEK